ncbi:tyrosine-type recombinase/integrase [Sphingomonas naphthae]|uniref:Tyrosine-type recombinase/integrase n=1 Tax=Sphingomonas naphthae TaxID=1813468 RepID=A0ABY7TL91_9SPHN|nr:tyrosine-type recombinase/integrase [Sphingomonas naphthae]WCT72624.1 tyrosine-type recombinase/integrase [Sphingomonas naphthae]
MTGVTNAPRNGRSKRDVAPFPRGDGAVPLAPQQAKTQLGCALNTIFKIAYLGAIKVTVIDSGLKREYRFHLQPGADRAYIYESWLARVRCWNHQTAVIHKDLRAACAIPADHPQPSGLDRFCCETFARIGTSSRLECTAFFVDKDRKAEDRDRLRAQLATSDWAPSGSHSTARVESWAVVARFPAVDGLPDTSLDPQAADPAEPSTGLIGRAMALGPFAAAATMFAFVATASDRDEKLLRTYVRGFANVDAQLGVQDLSAITGEDIERLLVSMLEEAAKGGRGCASLYETCQRYRTATRYLRSYVARVDGDGSRGLAAHLPPDPSSPTRVYKALAEAKNVVVLEGGVRRKRLSNRAAVNLDRHIAANRSAMEQITAIREDALVAADEVVLQAVRRDAMGEAEARRTPAFREFLVTVPVLDPKGDIVRGASQTLVFWAWRERDAWLSLEHGALRRQRGMRPKGRKDAQSIAKRALVDAALDMKIKDVQANEGKYGDVVFEYRGCRPDRPGGLCQEPRFVTLARLGVDIAPSHLMARCQRRRHRLMQNWNIVPHIKTPGGLLTFENDKSVLIRWMNARNRVMVPIHEVYFATLFGTLGFDILTETLARLSEAIQPEQDIARWKLDEAIVPPVMGFLAATKAHPGKPKQMPRPLGVSDPLFESIMAAAEEIARANGHADGWLPAVDEPPGRPGEADASGNVVPPRRRPLVFQWRGRALPPAEVAELVSWLMANRGRVTPHVLRHAAANQLRQMGVPERVVQAILGHKSLKSTAWYMSPDARRARMEAAIQRRGRRIGAASLQAGRAGVRSEGKN